MRYVILVLLNLPVIVLAITNFITRYKLAKIDKVKFQRQIIMWLVILVVLVGSFPVYNILSGKPVLDSHELSIFDIVQTAAIILLFYILNNQHQKVEKNERYIRDLHQELSIRLSTGNNDKTAR